MTKDRTRIVLVASLALGGLAGLALVTASRPSAADAPSGRLTVSAGTVTDTVTGLVWQQAVPATLYTWNDALTYCRTNTAGLPGSGWRLPSVSELQTIVDDSGPWPAIDATAFPSTPALDFWTSTTYAIMPASIAVLVDFYDGSTTALSMNGSYDVRCVR